MNTELSAGGVEGVRSVKQSLKPAAGIPPPLQSDYAAVVYGPCMMSVLLLGQAERDKQRDRQIQKERETDIYVYIYIKRGRKIRTTEEAFLIDKHPRLKDVHY